MTPPAQTYGRKMKRSDYRVIPHRWFKVLSLHLAGKTIKEIKQETGYADSTIYNILDNEEVNTCRQQMLLYYDKEFEALFPQVIQAIRQGLASQDEYLQAAALWAKMSGKGQKQSQGNINVNISAENIAMMLLQKAKGQDPEDPEDSDSDIPGLKVYDPSKLDA